MAAGSYLAATGDSKIGAFVIFAGLAGTLGVALAIRGRRSMNASAADLGRSGRHSGVVPDPAAVAVGETGDVSASRWVGAARVPSALGFMEVGSRLAVLEVAQGRMVLRVRPALVRLMFGMKNLAVDPADGALCSPVSGAFLKGVEIQLAGQPPRYFWTNHGSEVLRAAGAAGFDVSYQQRNWRKS
jgi:hypothetical protein